MALVSATTTEFAAFLTQFGYSVAETHDPLIELSFVMLKTIPFYDVDDVPVATVVQAQCFIAYAMSAEGGGFDAAAIAEARELIEKGLGRGALRKKWQVDQSLNGTHPVHKLRLIPLAYGLLKDYIRYGASAVYVV